MSQVTLKLPHVCRPLHVHVPNIAGGTFRTLVQLLSGLHMSANSQLHHKVQSGLVIIELVKLHYVRVTDPVCAYVCVYMCVVCACVWCVHVCGVCGVCGVWCVCVVCVVCVWCVCAHENNFIMHMHVV